MQLSPRNPVMAFTVYVAGLGPSHRASVMAQVFGLIHELASALTQSANSTVAAQLRP